MNPLLSQFLAEAADLLSQVDDGLLQLELDPADAERVNEVFRAAHTLKGSSGLFDFPELTHLTHAAEDLLDAVRAGRVALDSAITDDLLAAFDLIRSWLGHVTTDERLPSDAAGAAGALITRLREPLGGGAALPVVAAGVDTGARTHAPAWIAALDPACIDDIAGWLGNAGASMRFVRYLPQEDCFFRGEDPLHLIRQVPALHHLAVEVPDWGELDDYDEYAARLGFVLATRADVHELRYLFRYVPDEVEIVELNGPALLDPEPADAPPADLTPTDPAAISHVRAVLEAACLGLAPVGDRPDGEVSEASRRTRLQSVARAVSAAAAALGETLDLSAADADRLLATAKRLLGRLTGAPEEAPPAAARPRPAEPARGDADTAQVGTRVLKVDQEKVDRLMELVGELNVAKNSLTFLAEAAEEEYGSRALARRIKDQYAGLHRIAEDLQAAVMDVRMLPLSVSFSRFPRLVRDIGRRLGKHIDLVTDGEDTMADKDVIEALADPLVHLVRNSLDHGIEPPADRIAAGKAPTARIGLTAVADGDAVLIEVTDDGRGIDPARVRQKAYEQGLIAEAQLETISDAEAVNLVFKPGFSTADQISDLSGRGVGMDAVRASVERMGGTVTMRSRLGEGTTTTLRLPLSMAVTQVMVVSVAGQRFGVPVDLVVETVRIPAGQLNRVLHQDVVVLRDEVIPVVDLATALDMPWQPQPGADLAILVVHLPHGKAGVLVERLHREVDVILKPMDGLLSNATQFVGTALLGDGLVLLVLNLKEVIGVAAATA